MKTQIVRVGNSQGIHIPKLLLDQVGLGTEVEPAVLQDQLLIRRALRPRHGWRERFRAMAEHEEDRLLDEATLTQWDASE